MYVPIVDWELSGSEALSSFIHLFIAYVLAFPVGWNREAKSRSAGLRTFPLVACAACGYGLIGQYVLDNSDAQSRVAYGIITGIGFIGGGAILKQRNMVTGTATAAAMWNMGALGLAVAWGQIEIALMLSIMAVGTLYLTAPLKGYLADHTHQDDPDESPRKDHD